MSTTPTTPVPTTTTPSRRARAGAKLNSYYQKATVHEDTSQKGFALLVILGFVAAIITGFVLWAQSSGEYASHSFIKNGTTTLAVSVIIQAVILFFRSGKKPAWSQVAMIIALVIFVKWPMGWVYTAFNNDFAKSVWGFLHAGFVTYWLSMLLLFVLIFKITAPQVANPELVTAKAELDKAKRTEAAHQEAVDDLVKPVEAAQKKATDSEALRVTADEDLEKLTKARNKAQKKHSDFLKEKKTVAAIAAVDKDIVDAETALRKAETALEAARKLHKDAAERKAFLPGEIAKRQNELSESEHNRDVVALAVTTARSALDANPADKSALADYNREVKAHEAAKKLVAALSGTVAELTTEEAKSDNNVRTHYGKVRAAESTVETNEKLVKAAKKAAETTRKKLNTKSVTGMALVASEKLVKKQGDKQDTAKRLAKADKDASERKVSEATTADTVLTGSKEVTLEKQTAYDKVAESGTKTQKKRVLVIVGCFVGFVVCNVAIYGYLLTQHVS